MYIRQEGLSGPERRSQTFEVAARQALKSQGNEPGDPFYIYHQVGKARALVAVVRHGNVEIVTPVILSGTLFTSENPGADRCD